MPIDRGESISCRICRERGLSNEARRAYAVLHHSDSSTWIHYDCEDGHAFHQALGVDPPRILNCNCEAPD